MPSMGGPQAGDDVTGSGYGGYGGNDRNDSPGFGGAGINPEVGGQVLQDMGDADLASEMVQAGMDPNNAIDWALADWGTKIGLPPNPAKASHMAIMSPFMGAVPYASTVANISQALHQPSPLKALGTMGLDHLVNKTGLGALGNLALGFMEKPSIGEYILDYAGVEKPEGALSGLDDMLSGLVTPGQDAPPLDSFDYSSSTPISYEPGEGQPYVPELSSPIANTSPQAAEATSQLSQLSTPSSSTYRLKFNPYGKDLSTYGQDPAAHSFFLKV